MGDSAQEITEVLKKWGSGDRESADALLPLVYEELRTIASQCVRRERSGHTLQPTALVHEAYLRLVDISDLDWKDRLHFFAVSATVMRRILVDYARARLTEKRGGAAQRISLDDASDLAFVPDVDLLALDEALKQLAKIDRRQCRIVELRYFGGLTLEETADILEISPATVKREWAMARSWLFRQLQRTV